MNSKLNSGPRFASHQQFQVPRLVMLTIVGAMTLSVLQLTTTSAWAQAVCLPAPRLLTTMPMGGQLGTSVEITITGANFENADQLSFSHPGITATPKLDDAGKPIANRFMVNIAKDCLAGIHEARVMTRLGVSSSRAFNVGTLTEVTQTAANTTLETAAPLPINSTCNAVMTKQAVSYYSFEAAKDQRIVVDCAATGIDSKLKPVVIIADAQGADLVVERRGGALDFTVPETGQYVIKLHDLTFNGGAYYFYRLAVKEAAKGEAVPRLPSTETVSSFSWPPTGLPATAAASELEPNNEHAQAKKSHSPAISREASSPLPTSTRSNSRQKRATSGGLRSRPNDSVCRPIRRSSFSTSPPTAMPRN